MKKGDIIGWSVVIFLLGGIFMMFLIKLTVPMNTKIERHTHYYAKHEGRSK